MARIKHLWKGFFRFRGKLSVEYCQAYSEKQAKQLMISRIAKKQGVHPGLVWDKFRDTGCEIKLEVEFKEVPDVQPQ